MCGLISLWDPIFTPTLCVSSSSEMHMTYMSSTQQGLTKNNNEDTEKRLPLLWHKDKFFLCCQYFFCRTNETTVKMWYNRNIVLSIEVMKVTNRCKVEFEICREQMLLYLTILPEFNIWNSLAKQLKPLKTWIIGVPCFGKHNICTCFGKNKELHNTRTYKSLTFVLKNWQ